MDKYEQQFIHEITFIGCLIKDNSLFQESKITTENFSEPYNRNLFKVMKEMYDKDEIISLDSLRSLPDAVKISFDGYERVKTCFDYAYSLHSFEWLHKTILEFNAVERIRNLTNEFLLDTQDQNKAQSVLDFQKKIDEIDLNQGVVNKSTKQILADTVKYHEETDPEGLSGIDTGFNNINRVTDGFQKTELIVVGARPSLGKTALTLNMLIKGILNNPKQYGTFFSCEMSIRAIMNRIISYESGINLGKMRNPNKLFDKANDWINYSKAIGKIEKYTDRFEIREESSVVEIRAAVRKIIRDHPNYKHVFFIDHLDHVRVDKSFTNKVHEVGEIMHQLKKIAKDFDVTIVLLAQLNRAVEKQENKRPMMSDLRESGTIEQIADLILLLYRDSYYDENQRQDPKFEVLIRKQRDGVLGTIYLNFYPALSKFTDY